MASFEVIIPWLLYQEDSKKTPGLILNEGDGDGLTRLGLTSRFYSKLVPADFFTTMPFTNAVQVAKSVYQDQFWHHLNGDRINSEQVAAPLLSFAVNRNIPTAVKILQSILEVEQDGVLGLITVAVLNEKDPNIVAKLFRASWANYYHRIASVNPNDAQFLDGWINRANFPFPSPLVPNIYV
jgi:lysozyme family protein